MHKIIEITDTMLFIEQSQNKSHVVPYSDNIKSIYYDIYTMYAQRIYNVITMSIYTSNIIKV